MDHYLALKLFKWEDAKFTLPAHIGGEGKAKTRPGEIGFYPVFDNYQACLACAGSPDQVVPIKYVPGQEKVNVFMTFKKK